MLSSGVRPLEHWSRGAEGKRRSAEPVPPPDHMRGSNLQACVQATISALPLINNLAVFCFTAMSDWSTNLLEADESTSQHYR